MKIKLRTSPWSHQRDAIRFALARPGALLAMEMGTGKSLCAIALIGAIEAIGATPERGKILVLCPKAVIVVWRDELAAHAGFDYTIDHRRDSGDRRAARVAKTLREAQGRVIVVLNYESAITDRMRNALLDVKWDLTILDEIHRAKNADSKTGELAEALGRVSRKRIGLTGTPTPHSPLDIFGQMRFLEPSVLGTSLSRFRAKFARQKPLPPLWFDNRLQKEDLNAAGLLEFPAGPRHGEGAEEYEARLKRTRAAFAKGRQSNPRPGDILQLKERVVGVKDLPALEALIRPYIFRVRADDVLDLPESHHVVRPVELGPTAEGIYRDMEEECIALVRDAAGNRAALTANGALAQMLKLQAITGGMVADEEKRIQRIGEEKREALVELFEDLDPAEPVVAFARFRTDLLQIHEAADQAKRQSLELSGSRDDYEKWRRPDAPTVLAVQIQSGGAGINLTRASKFVYWSKDFNLANYEQSLARGRRPGQKHRVTYFHLLARFEDGTKTIDGDLHESLEKRADFIEEFLRRVTSAREAS